ncbi:MAG: hypothetical protein LBB68_03020 [Treponema sp.]|jgi:hypothetical protein|nr:hypothetical protein [Treponema sp.]
MILKNLLDENNLTNCISVFEQHRLFDIDTVSDLTEADLEKIGISALGDRKKILRLFSSKPEYYFQDRASQMLQQVVVQHATMCGEDASTGFGKGFGETVGKKAGGCAWSLGILVIIVVVIAIILSNL